MDPGGVEHPAMPCARQQPRQSEPNPIAMLSSAGSLTPDNVAGIAADLDGLDRRDSLLEELLVPLRSPAVALLLKRVVHHSMGSRPVCRATPSRLDLGEVAHTIQLTNLAVVVGPELRGRETRLTDVIILCSLGIFGTGLQVLV